MGLTPHAPGPSCLPARARLQVAAAAAERGRKAAQRKAGQAKERLQKYEQRIAEAATNKVGRACAWQGPRRPLAPRRPAATCPRMPVARRRRPDQPRRPGRPPLPSTVHVRY